MLSRSIYLPGVGLEALVVAEDLGRAGGGHGCEEQRVAQA